MEFVDNFGILTPIDWNSTGWTQPPTTTDLKNTHFGYVKQNQDAAESLNFGHEVYPDEEDGTYIGYSPKLNVNLVAESLGAVFFSSTDHNQKCRCIVGVYGFPQVGEFMRRAKHKMFKKYNWGNVRSLVGDIVYFSNPVVITDNIAARLTLLPVGKALAKRGFNYLTSENVVNVLRLAAQLNQHDRKLAALLNRFEIDPVEDIIEVEGLSGLGFNPSADTLAGIAELEKKMQELRPKAKQRVATFIERGRIAASVKRHTNYKCLLCEAMGLNPIGFIKSNGVPYVETHHVDPVVNQNVGALGLANILTLCANHHRQMHYGNVRLVKQTKTQFTYWVDGEQFVVKKIKP